MKTQVSVPIPTDLFVSLVDFLRAEGDGRDPVHLVADAIDYWLSNASWKSELLSTPSPESRGYTWKYKDSSVFLPHGTEIRMPYKGQYYYAKVEGDHIMFNGQAITPGAFANAVTKSSRNAWRDLWIKRPGEKEWTLADESRRVSTANKLLDELDATGPKQ